MNKIAKYIGVAVALSMLGLSLYYYFHLKPLIDEREQLGKGMMAVKSGEYEEGLAILTPMATNGNHTAQRIVGDLYAFGWGTEHNFGESVKWHRLADAINDRMGYGEYYAAKRFEDDYGNRYGDVSLNAKNTVMYYKSSAEVGYVKAADRLAEIYGEGLLGFAPDQEEAQHWREYSRKIAKTEPAR